MKLSMELTLDGLVRALRRQAHALAEDAEAGYVSGEPSALVGRQAHHEGFWEAGNFRRKGSGLIAQDEEQK